VLSVVRVLAGADNGTQPFNPLGEDLLAYIVLALGGALLAGNVAAIIRPPAAQKEGDLGRAPLRRSLLMAAVGFVATVWAVASLVT